VAVKRLSLCPAKAPVRVLVGGEVESLQPPHPFPLLRLGPLARPEAEALPDLSGLSRRAEDDGLCAEVPGEQEDDVHPV